MRQKPLFTFYLGGNWESSEISQDQLTPELNPGTFPNYNMLVSRIGSYLWVASEICCCLVCLVAKLSQTLCDPVDCSLPGSSVHGISQARILEWVAISFSSWSSKCRDQTSVSCIGRPILYHWTTRETSQWHVTRTKDSKKLCVPPFRLHPQDLESKVKIQLTLAIHGRLVPRLTQIPKSKNPRLLFVKWCSVCF